MKRISNKKQIAYLKMSTFGVGGCPLNIQVPSVYMSLKALKLAHALVIELMKCKVMEFGEEFKS